MLLLFNITHFNQRKSGCRLSQTFYRSFLAKNGGTQLHSWLRSCVIFYYIDT